MCKNQTNLDGLTRSVFNSRLDSDSKKVQEGGYFGCWIVVKKDGKYNIVYQDMRDAICVLASDEWFDSVFYCQWDPDGRWNHDDPAIVKKDGKFALLKAPQGGMRMSSDKMPIISGWFDSIEARSRYDETLHRYFNATINGKNVKITINGGVVVGNPKEELEIVKKFSKDEIVEKWIKKGRRCVYRYGYAFRGARSRVLTMEDALKKFPNYSFGKGFYSLSWLVDDGLVTLEFNELSANDMW